MELSLNQRDLHIQDTQRIAQEERKSTDECIQSKNREIESAHIEELNLKQLLQKSQFDCQQQERQIVTLKSQEMDNLELIQEITELRGRFDMLQKEFDLVSQEK